MTDILIQHATVVTMDPRRRVIEDGAVAITNGRIAAVGPTEEVRRAHGAADTVIDGRRKLALPGLIDAHAHAGHGLVKTLGGDDGEVWYKACRDLYTRYSTPEFWEAEAMLSAVERVKAGVTTGVSYLGGGDSIMRTDDAEAADRHCAAIERVGTRSFLAIGPNRPPFPWTFAVWENGGARQRSISVDDQLDTCAAIVDRWHGGARDRVRISMSYPVHHPTRELPDGVTLAEIADHARRARALGKDRGLLFTQDGHREGTIAFAHEAWDFLGPDAYLSHCVDITEREVAIAAETGTRIVHNPSAVASIRGRCPVPELLDRGVTVAIGSDGTAPDRSFDMFRHMQQCMHYHRRHFRDDQVLPPGKVLEMVTIDAAKALDMDFEIGSLEVGKRADVILLDMAKPHLTPANMPVHRAVYFANGADVDTTICDGRVLMAGRKLMELDELDVLDTAEREAALAIERAGLVKALETRGGFWGRSRY